MQLDKIHLIIIPTLIHNRWNILFQNQWMSQILLIKKPMKNILKNIINQKRKKRKKRKKKGKKLKKSLSKKNINSPLIMAESESIDLWDAFEAEAKTKQREEEKKKKKIAEKYLYKTKDNESDSVSSVSSENDGISKAKKKKKKKKKKITIKQSEIDKKLDPKYRKKEREKKAAKNLSRTGFKVKVNRRYRIDDGRIGICRYRGRTAFGKDGEDWIGMMVEYGDGIHNGTVKGKKYFICAANKGIMVRPQRIVQDLGLPNGQTLNKKMIKGSKSIRKLLQDIAFEKEEEYQKKLKMKKKKKKKEAKEDEMYEEDWKPPKFDGMEEDHGDAFAPKLLHQAHKFKNGIKPERKLKIDEI